MACRNCQLDTPKNLCQVCEAIEALVPRVCKQCGAPLDDPNWLGRFCHVCNTLYEVVRASQWFSQAQAEWVHENFELARRKRALLGQPTQGAGPHPDPLGPMEGFEQP
ncbi:MAG TPA: hypothetical protein VNN17_10690 [Terriglobia bacterium]|nr:hypothetical protein [Terriglobia bacterium]